MQWRSLLQFKPAGLLDDEPIRHNPEIAALHPGSERHRTEDLRKLGVQHVLLRAAQYDVEEAPAGRIGHDAHRFPRADIRLFLDRFDGGLQASELIDEAVIFRLRAKPDPPLRNGVDLGIWSMPRARYLCDEIVIALVDARA